MNTNKDAEEKNEETKKLLNELASTQSVTNSVTKLNKKSLEVIVYRHTSAVQALEQELSLTSGAITKEKAKSKVDEATLEHLNKRKQFCEEELKKHENNKIEAVMVPLSYRDISNIKAAVTEAVLSFQKFKFDKDVQMIRIAAEERLMTVFCALRKKENPQETYFESLEEIVLADDVTMDDLHAIWEKHFVLTDTEIKN